MFDARSFSRPDHAVRLGPASLLPVRLEMDAFYEYYLSPHASIGREWLDNVLTL